MDLGIRGRVALVSGASEGLGHAAARVLAAEGVRLAIAARRADRLEDAAQAIRAETGATVATCPGDVTDRDQAIRIAREAVSKLGPIEILVVNAGGPRPGAFQDFSWNDWVDAFRAVVGPVHHLVSAILPGMRQSRWGRIVSIQSMSIRQPVEALLLSNALRPAAAGLLKGLAAELAPHGITVNVVGPGPCRTERILELGRHRNPGMAAEELSRKMGAEVPIGRLVEPDEVGAAIAFLCSFRAAAITGSYVPVDGGTIRSQM